MTVNDDASIIAQVRKRAMAAKLNAWLLSRAGDAVADLWVHSRRGARLAERLATDRPSLTVASMIAELSSDRARAVPRNLIDRLAYALHRDVEKRASLPPADFAASIQPQQLSLGASSFVARVHQLQAQLRREIKAQQLETLPLPRRARVLLEERQARFFYTEDVSAVPHGLALPVHDIPAAFIAVRGPMLDVRRQLYALDRILDLVLEPVGDEATRIDAMLASRLSPLLLALDAFRGDGTDVQGCRWQVRAQVDSPLQPPTLMPMDEDGPLTIDRRKKGAWMDAVRRSLGATTADATLATALDAQGHNQLTPAVFAYLDDVTLVGATGMPMSMERVGLEMGMDDDHRLFCKLGGVVLSAEQMMVVRQAQGAAVVHQHVLQMFRLRPETDALMDALARMPGIVPPEARAEVLQRLRSVTTKLGSSGQLQVRVPAAAKGKVRPALTTMLAKVSLRSGGGEVSLWSAPAGLSLAQVPGEGPAELYDDDGHVVRDRRAERMAVAALADDLGFHEDEQAGRHRYQLSSRERSLEVLSLLAGRADVAIALAQKNSVRFARQASLLWSPRPGTDWLHVEGSVTLDHDQHMALQPLLDAIRAGQRFVLVDDIAVVIDAALAAELEPLAAHIDDRGQLNKNVAQVLSLTPTQQVSFPTGSMAVDVADIVPPGLNATLRSYQQAGLLFLRQRAAAGLGAILADEMGLGKTLQATALLLERSSLGPAMVVGPTSLTHHWVAELARFAPSLQVTRIDSGKQLQQQRQPGPGEVWVSSYGVVSQGQRAWSSPWATLLLDEAHALKNPAAQRREAVAAMPRSLCIALTGTPMENHTGELWSLLDLVVPGVFGTSANFKAQYAGPIDRDQDQRARQRLRQAIQPFVLRRKKSEVARELPEKVETLQWVEPSPEEKRGYELLRQAWVTKLADADKRSDVDGETRLQILQALTQLRLYANHPNFVGDGLLVSNPSAGSKQRALLALVQELVANGHRCLVFSQFVRHLQLAQSVLQQAGITTSYLDGGTSSAERARLVERFQAGLGGDAFCISLKAGGVGLNLTRASYVIHLDPWWNPAAEDQATDRAHRIGQTQPVHVVRLVTLGTIEADILNLHERKRSLVDAILAGTDAAATMTLREMLELVRVVPSA